MGWIKPTTETQGTSSNCILESMYTAFLSNRLGSGKKIQMTRLFVDYLLLVGVELFTESNAELLAETLECLEVLLVLVLSLDLGLDTYSEEKEMCKFAIA
jgi:hypothetical protein